ncbi:RNA polymerase sigma factor [Nonomuraea cavernae]|uniref:RNA polymerase sigma factor n=1 Tax=Nonomuraea cavernae TaxID=2045107 RepID=A0A917ZCZ9_9ACTN|nr:sigma-70 family RNA polymerase sigma factor [Nonomuraea cavernae]MCA2188789.1 sigma-70 family RNA polymerase sigma factor [Nonomuraea cavernae]GGO81050.1 RNA polymerase sigma factor [Nonomuraea cavernae]
MDDTGALVRAAADGDAGAWKELYHRHTGLVWSVARSYLPNDSDAQDVCQTTWFRLAEHLTRLREPEKVGSWLASTARHEALRVVRTSGRSMPVSDVALLGLDIDERSPELLVLEAEEAGAERQRAQQVWDAFQELPDRCRRLLRVLISSPRPSYQEIAAGLDLAVGSVGPIRARCLKKLGELIARRGVTGIPR